MYKLNMPIYVDRNIRNCSNMFFGTNEKNNYAQIIWKFGQH